MIVFFCLFVLGWGFHRGVSTEHLWEESSRVEGGGRGQDRKSYSSPLPPPVGLFKESRQDRAGEREERPRLFSPPLISLFSKVFLAAPLCFHSSFYRAGVETRCGCCSSAVAVAVAQQNVKQNKVQQAAAAAAAARF